jgi:hypothetical protein
MPEYENLRDAYVFIRGAGKNYLDKLVGLPGSVDRIRYTAVLTGDWDGVAAVTFEDLREVEPLVFENLRENPETSTAIGLWPAAPLSLKWSISYPEEAWVRVWVEPGQAIAVAANLMQLTGNEGVAVVAADFDVLTAFGAGTFDELKSLLLTSLHPAAGIRRTATSFVLRSSERPGG